MTEATDDNSVAPDLVAAVLRVFPPGQAPQVLRTLAALPSDRLRVDVLVSATLARPDHRKIEELAREASIDFRDVLMVEYDQQVDYRARLRYLGLDRPYPVK